MVQEKQNYLETQLSAEYRVDKQTISIVFQKEKIKLEQDKEIGMLDDIGTVIEKEVIFSEDELILKFHKPPYFRTFSQLIELDERSRYIFASQLVKAVKNHAFPRLHLFICPENILIDESLSPHFLHYGVKESLPPYERDFKREWSELKAAVATAVDDKFSFEQFLHFNQTIELTETAAKIISAEDEEQLQEFLIKKIKEIEQRDNQFVKISQKKWKSLKFSAIGLVAVLVPLLIFTLYTLIITYPRQAAFIESQEHFLRNHYSEVINTLSNYQVESMPRVIQHQLAFSYLINESLSESQKDNVFNTITLQSDPLYAKYWIHIGRGEPKEALTIARQLEDFDLIMYALIHYEEAVKADSKMKEEDKQRELNQIKSEKEEYERNIQDQLENEENVETEKGTMNEEMTEENERKMENSNKQAIEDESSSEQQE